MTKRTTGKKRVLTFGDVVAALHRTWGAASEIVRAVGGQRIPTRVPRATALCDPRDAPRKLIIQM